MEYVVFEIAYRKRPSFNALRGFASTLSSIPFCSILFSTVILFEFVDLVCSSHFKKTKRTSRRLSSKELKEAE